MTFPNLLGDELPAELAEREGFEDFFVFSTSSRFLEQFFALIDSLPADLYNRYPSLAEEFFEFLSDFADAVIKHAGKIKAR
ncbi:MAG: hypothetical protein QXR87_06910 [Candidatus Hadarchaeales archaeon]